MNVSRETFYPQVKIPKMVPPGGIEPPSRA